MSLLSTDQLIDREGPTSRQDLLLSVLLKSGGALLATENNCRLTLTSLAGSSRVVRTSESQPNQEDPNQARCTSWMRGPQRGTSNQLLLEVPEQLTGYPL